MLKDRQDRPPVGKQQFDIRIPTLLFVQYYSNTISDASRKENVEVLSGSGHERSRGQHPLIPLLVSRVPAFEVRRLGKTRLMTAQTSSGEYNVRTGGCRCVGAGIHDILCFAEA